MLHFFVPDTVYVVHNNNSHIAYNGWRSSRVVYNFQKDIWVASHGMFKYLHATIKAPIESLLLGTHLWTIHNDTTRYDTPL